MPALQTAYGGISAYMRIPDRAPRKLFLVLLSALLVLGLIPLSSAAASAGDQVWVEVGQSEAYDGYETNYFKVDGQMAWCSQPEKASPPGGWTTVDAITAGDSSDQAAVMALALVAADELTRWGVTDPDGKFGTVPEGTSDALAGSILDALNGPLTMHNTEDSRYARFHVILSYIANEAWPGWCSPVFGASNAAEWTEQCEAFYDLCRKIVAGDDLSAYGISKADRDAAVQVARSSEIGWTNYGAPGQSLIWLYRLGEAKGWLQVEKKATNDRVAAEVGLSPTPAGAKFELYGSDDDGNIDKTDLIATLTTNSSGVAQSPWLTPNRWYYVVEVEAPDGYELPAAEAARTQYTYVYANSDPSVCDSRNVVAFSDDPLAGWIQIDKSSANPDCTSGNAAYTLAGAVFGIYSDAACTKLVGTMTTDAKGFAESDWLRAGKDYWVKETKAPQGFDLDPTAHKLAVKSAVSKGEVDYAGGATKLAVAETPVMDPADIKVKKVDADGNPAPQGTADTLYDAWYEFSFYAGDYSVVSKETAAAKAPTRKWVLRTDDTGYVALSLGADSFISKKDGSVPYKVSGDQFYLSSDGEIHLPFGTLVIKEVKAPAGYRISDKIFIEQYKPAADGGIDLFYPLGTDDFTDGNTWMSYDEVQKGGITFEKRDLESGLTKPLGAGSLDGTKFELYNKTGKTITVDGKQVENGKIVMSLTPVNGVCSTGNILPAGNYMVKEVKAGGGYKLTGGTEYSFTVKPDQTDTGKTGSGAFKNQVMRGDLELMKFDNDSKKALAGIPFKITSKTTGESHIIVTDANGYASTAAAWNKHTGKTNANDAALSPDGTVDESKLDDTAGVWFGEDTAPNDGLGALPYDTYVVEELRVAANAKFAQMFRAEKVMNRDGYTIDLTRVDNENGTDMKPRLSTHLYDASDLDKVLAADSASTVVDEVYYEGLASGEAYKLESSLHDPATGDILSKPDGTPARWVKEFTPVNGNSGYVSATMQLDSRSAKNGAVAYERIVAADGTVVATEADPENIDQTVYVSFPEIRTKATEAEGGKVLLAREDAVVVDEVSYAGVIPGRAYVLEATLMDKATGEALVGEDGQPVTASKEFEPIAASGTADVEIALSTLGIDDGAEIVVFERLLLDGATVASHEDISDEGQTVTVAAPSIGTSAVDAADGDKVLASHGRQAVVDRVRFSNVVPGRTHVLTAAIMDKATGEPLEGTEPVVHEFVPQQREGVEEVRIAIPDGAAAGKELVVFEQLAVGDVTVANHEDIDDAGQTVYVEEPGIGTQAVDATDGDKSVNAGPAAKVVDTVSYSGLVPGYTYKLTATLMDKATGEPVEVAGKPVTAKKSFNPFSSEGTVEVEIAFDATQLAGHDVVVFEQLALGADIVASHEDIDDEGQTVRVEEPSVGTQASDAADGDKEVFAAPGMRIKDAVSYAGLTPGYTYKLTATLMDKATGEPVEVAGKPVTATQTFNPAAPEGTVEVEIVLDATQLAGHDVVVFERLALGADIVAAHEDIDDEGQTVRVEEPGIGTQAVDAADGDKTIAAGGAKVKDTVSFSGLKPGVTYTVAGKLMDKSTGEPVTVEGREVTASAEFTPVASEGEVDVVFEFDATQLAGRDLVAFEQVFAPWAETAIAVHEDIDDEGQTVFVEQPGAPLSETGDVLHAVPFALAALAGLAALLIARGGMERARRDAEEGGR